MSMHQYEMIKKHLIGHTALSQIISTLNDSSTTVTDSLLRVIGKTNVRPHNLGNDLLQDYRSTFWSEVLPVWAAERTPIQEALHGKSEEYLKRFNEEIGEDYPLFAAERDHSMLVVCIDYMSSEPRYNIHVISERGMLISTLAGVRTIDGTLEHTEPLSY